MTLWRVFFSAASGLRQGDLVSPYLFVLALEVFTACMKKLESDALFKYHYQAKSLEISHLIFADDVLLFSHGDKDSIELLLKGVKDFAAISGLHTNLLKSSCFFADVDAVI